MELECPALKINLFEKHLNFDMYSPTLTQSNVNALIELKLEKHKNLREESGFYWREISDGTFKFDRRECEVRN